MDNKKEVPWKERDYSIDEVSSWGKSVCFEEEGGSGRKNDSIFFALETDTFHQMGISYMRSNPCWSELLES